VEQHVISEWLLKAFARRAPAGPILDLYDKTTDRYGNVKPGDFMTEVDAHSTAIERGIGCIEGPASRAALQLAKRVKNLPPGFYAVVPSPGEIRASGSAMSDKGLLQGQRVLVSEYQIPSPSQADRLALGRYAGLMYQRAPKTETAIMGFGAKYDLAAQQALDRLMPGMRTGLATELARRRSRMLAHATDIGGQLAEANWWVVRAGKGEAFLLGDSPVAVTDSLGHDDEWRAIFSPESYAVVMPLGPTFTLLIAPQRIIPIAGIDIDLAGVTLAINRLMWRYADRYVLAHDRTQLEAAWPEADERRRSSVDANVDTGHVAVAAARDVTRIAMELWWRRVKPKWRHWTSCRLEFGLQPWPAEDRYLLASPLERGSGPRPAVDTISPIRRR
jgi:Protein of unknown function (DUF4238)